ncbi:hypothetical protein SAMN04489745_2144 [Arthrobacter woluwensis]|uniref:TetR family transcriptional regulator n=2 Tax=Arthrobacter woluwensis TaxID=156980 RepID=A0A1H4Q042_9MICC|nr:hypothetical protein [Arthrobacter woluwensis]SEC13006.1 hypothetical protein SAMN04489745_2144 [Arthrobacter woluwensis]
MGQDRREAICEAAVGLLARDGARGLTHHAVDRSLGLPLGSASYYFRTRLALLEATARWIAVRSRAELDRGLSGAADAGPGAPGRDGLPGAAAVVARQMELLLTVRRDQALARTALLGETSLPGDVRSALARCLFSHHLAENLMAGLGAHEPREAAKDLVTFLEGLVAEELWNASSSSATSAVATRVERHLKRLLAVA